MKVKIVNKSNNDIPAYSTMDSAGMDLRAFIEEPITLFPMRRSMIPTGLYIQLPSGYEAQIRPRSGIAIKNGISVINSPGTIDPDYTGQIIILLINLSNEPFTVNNGDRVAQMVINKYETCEWDTVDELTETVRGEGGFGSTKIK